MRKKLLLGVVVLLVAVLQSPVAKSSPQPQRPTDFACCAFCQHYDEHAYPDAPPGERGGYVPNHPTYNGCLSCCGDMGCSDPCFSQLCRDSCDCANGGSCP